jgi:CheY-like chemotaxis protein
MQRSWRARSPNGLLNFGHELRTPLNAIIGFSEILAETDLNEEQADYANTVCRSATSLLVLINDILDVAKIEAGKLEIEYKPFDIPDMIKNVSDMFKQSAREKGVSLTYAVDPQLPSRLIGDVNRLRQIMVNLTGNAMKFTHAGSVDISIECVRERSNGFDVRFSVRDTGVGIPPERQRTIFDKFTQADGSITRKYGGTGLGLAICKQLVELMDGSIALQSISGSGSVFAFTIPMEIGVLPQEKAALTPGVESEDRQPGAVSSKRLRVLLVEDNPVNRKLAVLIVKQAGCDVETASDGVDALEKLKTLESDLVLMDIQMPNMDGLEATRKIRELENSPMKQDYVGLRDRDAPITIIGLTAHARKEDEEESYAAGMDGFLTKPIVKKKLIEVLQSDLCNL